MSALNKAGLDANIAKFQFLCTIPTLDLTPRLEQDNCFICKESYQNNDWEPGGTVHCPVALSCGHILGFQCLVRWMFSPTFDNRCPLCRALATDASPVTEHSSRWCRGLAASFARLEVLAVLASDGISRAQKDQLLRACEKSVWSERAVWALSKDSDLVMAVWEEFLEGMCKEVEAPVEENANGDNPDQIFIPAVELMDEEMDEEFIERVLERMVANREARPHEDRPLALHEQVARWLLSPALREFKIGLLFGALNAAILQLGVLCGSTAGLDSVLKAMDSSWKATLGGYFLLLATPICVVFIATYLRCARARARA